MAGLFPIVTDLVADADWLRRRRYGVIEMRAGAFQRITLRLLPRLISLPEIYWGQWQRLGQDADRCLLYYNQPLRFSNFLALKYIVSARGTRLATFRGALTVLDEVARIKGADAIVADVANHRISARLLARWGWEPLAPRRWHRNYIKRFYGDYPQPQAARTLCANH